MLGQPVLHSRAQPTNQMPLRSGLLCVLSPFIPRRPFWASAGGERQARRAQGHTGWGKGSTSHGHHAEV